MAHRTTTFVDIRVEIDMHAFRKWLFDQGVTPSVDTKLRLKLQQAPNDEATQFLVASYKLSRTEADVETDS